MNKRVTILLLSAFAVLLAGCGKENLQLEHIHGLGYTSDGQTLLIPAHTGLIAFSNDKWSEAEAQKHDYMGFVTVDSGFYSSGHPGAGGKLENPLGIIQSSDMGKTIATRGLAGESDFHLMAAGYRTHTIYVFNPTPNSKMDTMGLYFSKDDASTWMRSQMNGITTEPLALATHPTDNKIVAIGTEQGLFISQNAGDDCSSCSKGEL
ncbi:F510_1955 family glycosylhydrolase [Cohnella sp. GCM10020058]|uniref:F510_1955 family glycosylhydrolase n=1 Tax=Cohnella sp. GCM10020058 TaxID=3317330 RepID=UPI003644A673